MADYEKTPKPPANHVNDRTVIVPIVSRNPNACRSISEMAELHVAHLNSFSGVYGCGEYMPKVNWSKTPRNPAFAVALISSAALWMINVYVSVRRGTVAVFW